MWSGLVQCRLNVSRAEVYHKQSLLKIIPPVTRSRADLRTSLFQACRQPIHTLFQVLTRDLCLIKSKFRTHYSDMGTTIHFVTFRTEDFTSDLRLRDCLLSDE